MKRLLAQIGITFFTVLAIVFYFPRAATAVLMGVSIVLTVLFFSIRKIRKKIFIPFIALSAALGCLFQLSFTALGVEPVKEKYEGAHRIEAYLNDEPYLCYDSYCYPLTVTAVDGEEARFNLIVKGCDALDAQVSDTLRFETTLYREENNYYRAKGYYLCARGEALTPAVESAKTRSLYYYAVGIRQYFRTILDELQPADDAALCRAVFLGDRYALSEDLRTQFRFSGASYFVVVSGMHFAIFVTLLLRVLRKLIKNRFIYLPIVLLFTMLYMAVTGFSPSVMRSGLMMVFYVVGLFFRRRVYPLNSLGMAGILMPLLFSPNCAGDIGLVLSFYATFAILQWSAPIYERIRLKNDDRLVKKIFNKVLELFSASLAANLTVLPISLFVFRAFSAVTLLSALLLYPEIWLILILVLIVCLLMTIPYMGLLGVLLSWVLYGICEAALFVVRTISKLPFSYIKVSDAFVYVWVILTVILFIAVYFCKGGYRYMRYALLGSLSILLCGAILTSALDGGKARIRVYPSDTGAFVTLEEDGRLFLLSTEITSYERYEAMRDLSQRYRECTFAITDTDTERKRLENICDEEFAISEYLQYDKRDEGEILPDTVDFHGECTVRVSDDTVITLVPLGDAAARYIVWRGRTVLILPDRCSPELLPEVYRTADIVILGDRLSGEADIFCDTLVLSGDSRLSLIEAQNLKDRYDRVLFSREGEITFVTE